MAQPESQAPVALDSWTTFHVLARSSQSEMLRFAEALSLRVGDARALASRLVLFFIQAERDRVTFVDVPSRAQVAARFATPIRRWLSHEEVLQRRSATIEVDGFDVPIPLTNAETEYLRILAEQIGASRQIEDVAFDAKVLSSARTQALRAIARRKLKPWQIAQHHVLDPVSPGPMRAFFAFAELGAWKLERRPWRRKLVRAGQVPVLRRTLLHPLEVAEPRTIGLNLLDPFVRARAALLDPKIPTGMRLAVMRHTDRDWGDAGEDLSVAIDRIRQAGADVIDTLVEVSELIQDADALSGNFRSAYRQVG